MISVIRMEVVVYVSPELLRTVKPWAGPNENAACEPFRTVISRRRASIGRHVVITIRAIGSDPDGDTHLRLRFRGGSREGDSLQQLTKVMEVHA